MRAASSMLLALPLGALVAGGCTRDVNDRLELGADVELPALQPQACEPFGATPTVHGLDRSHWEPMVYLVPVNGVAHMPPYAPPTYGLEATSRQRGEFPDAAGSLELGQEDPGDEIGQMFRSHGQAALDALLIVPRLFVRSPCATDWSPRWSYVRAPGGAVSAPWRPADEPAPTQHPPEETPSEERVGG